jgi:hypothetical protein
MTWPRFLEETTERIIEPMSRETGYGSQDGTDEDYNGI